MREKAEKKQLKGIIYVINKLQPMCRAIRQRREALVAIDKNRYQQGAVAKRASIDQRVLSTIETGNIGETPKPQILNGIASALSNSHEEAQVLLAEWLSLAGYDISPESAQQASNITQIVNGVPFADFVKWTHPEIVEAGIDPNQLAEELNTFIQVRVTRARNQDKNE